ncbi:hypothetical protein TorRG33x02_330090 [Trema orientale]|uniref:Uncharacterized protein n=1 Tax=Trema orientale TaxID=63057 RepID=A0A2P5B7P1_TREOI|nr:hypothetical protein TorRG33x02_330090 [Trema orientale]
MDTQVQSAERVPWCFTGFYDNPETHLRSFSWDLLKRSISSIVNFRQALTDCDLSDLGYSGSMVIWNNKQDSTTNIQECLDYCLGNDS